MSAITGIYESAGMKPLYREQARELPRPCLDPELEALLFHYGRDLLIGSWGRRAECPIPLI